MRCEAEFHRCIAPNSRDAGLNANDCIRMWGHQKDRAEHVGGDPHQTFQLQLWQRKSVRRFRANTVGVWLRLEGNTVKRNRESTQIRICWRKCATPPSKRSQSLAGAQAQSNKSNKYPSCLCWVSEEETANRILEWGEQSWTRIFCLSCVTCESTAAFACLHVGVLHVGFCSALSSRAASGVSKEGCWRRETSTARQQQLSSAADEEISNRRRQEEGEMLQIYRNKGWLRHTLIG